MDEEEYYDLTKRVFAFLAPIYDFLCLPISHLRQAVVDYVKPQNGSRVLDVATFTGQQAFAFGKRGCEVIGIDLSEAMLNVAQVKNRCGNVRFELMDATQLSFENESFDVCCISFALHDMPVTIREKVLNEMVRVTKVIGTVIIIDYALPKNRIGKWLVYHFVKIYEGPYYSEFVGSALIETLGGLGIETNKAISVLFGCVKIVRGMKHS